jgi:diguanylate cyclase (GGDEF)-like protein
MGLVPAPLKALATKLSHFAGNLSIGLKVNLTMGAVLAILLAAVLVLLITSVTDLTAQTGRERVDQEADVIQSRLDEAQEELMAASKLLATAPSMSEAIDKTSEGNLGAAVAVDAAPFGFDDVVVVDAAGARIAELVESDDPSNSAAEDDLLKLALLGIETERVIARDGELRLAAVVPLRSQSGAIAGGLLTSRDINDAFLDEINFARRDIHLALIRDDQILAHTAWPEEGAPLATAVDQSKPHHLGAMSQAQAGSPVTLDDLDTIDGTPYATGYVPLTVGSETPAVIELLVDVGKPVSFQNRLTGNLAVTFALLSLAAIGAMAFCVRQNVSVPLHKLGAAAERMASGDYGQRAQAKTKDETGRLARSFNAMASAVQEHAGRLTTTNEALKDEISERRKLEEQLKHQAFSDSLTGLANRARFLDRLEHALLRGGRSGVPLAVLFMDIDDFKSINDSLGHAAGDRLLAKVAERLKACTRPGDTVARLGGDEFGVLIEDLSGTSDAVEVADRLIDRLKAPFDLDDRAVSTRASIGIAVSSSGEQDADELLRCADIAMYVAKGHAKGQYQVYEPGMAEAVFERVQLLGELQQAVENREFMVHYQPLVVLRTGKIVAVEALVRWQHPQRGTLLPKDFIPLAEETGLIIPIGRWVLEQACRQTRSWQTSYATEPPLSVCVNISARELQQQDFPVRVARTLRQSGLNPQSLVLELTESVLIREDALDALRSLKEIGVQLAVDDFGTGYSSLSYLRQFPIDIIKIDKSFLNGIGGRTKERELARFIIELGRTLDSKIVAEGIERPIQLDRMQALGCEMGQGYHFGRPVEAKELDSILKNAGLEDVA